MQSLPTEGRQPPVRTAVDNLRSLRNKVEKGRFSLFRVSSLLYVSPSELRPDESKFLKTLEVGFSNICRAVARVINLVLTRTWVSNQKVKDLIIRDISTLNTTLQQQKKILQEGGRITRAELEADSNERRQVESLLTEFMQDCLQLDAESRESNVKQFLEGEVIEPVGRVLLLNHACIEEDAKLMERMNLEAIQPDEVVALTRVPVRKEEFAGVYSDIFKLIASIPQEDVRDAVVEGLRGQYSISEERPLAQWPEALIRGKGDDVTYVDIAADIEIISGCITRAYEGKDVPLPEVFQSFQQMKSELLEAEGARQHWRMIKGLRREVSPHPSSGMKTVRTLSREEVKRLQEMKKKQLTLVKSYAGEFLDEFFQNTKGGEAQAIFLETGEEGNAHLLALKARAPADDADFSDAHQWLFDVQGLVHKIYSSEYYQNNPGLFVYNQERLQEFMQSFMVFSSHIDSCLSLEAFIKEETRQAEEIVQSSLQNVHEGIGPDLEQIEQRIEELLSDYSRSGAAGKRKALKEISELLQKESIYTQKVQEHLEVVKIYLGEDSDEYGQVKKWLEGALVVKIKLEGLCEKQGGEPLAISTSRPENIRKEIIALVEFIRSNENLYEHLTRAWNSALFSGIWDYEASFKRLGSGGKENDYTYDGVLRDANENLIFMLHEAYAGPLEKDRQMPPEIEDRIVRLEELVERMQTYHSPEAVFAARTASTIREPLEEQLQAVRREVERQVVRVLADCEELRGVVPIDAWKTRNHEQIKAHFTELEEKAKTLSKSCPDLFKENKDDSFILLKDMVDDLEALRPSPSLTAKGAERLHSQVEVVIDRQEHILAQMTDLEGVMVPSTFAAMRKKCGLDGLKMREQWWGNSDIGRIYSHQDHMIELLWKGRDNPRFVEMIESRLQFWQEQVGVVKTVEEQILLKANYSMEIEDRYTAEEKWLEQMEEKLTVEGDFLRDHFLTMVEGIKKCYPEFKGEGLELQPFQQRLDAIVERWGDQMPSPEDILIYANEVRQSMVHLRAHGIEQGLHFYELKNWLLQLEMMDNQQLAEPQKERGRLGSLYQKIKFW